MSEAKRTAVDELTPYQQEGYYELGLGLTIGEQERAEDGDKAWARWARKILDRSRAFEPGGAAEMAVQALEGAQTALDIHHRDKDCKATVCTLIRHALAALDTARESE